MYPLGTDDIKMTETLRIPDLREFNIRVKKERSGILEYM